MTESEKNLRNYSAAVSNPQAFIVPDNCAGMRFDQVLAKLLPEYSRSRLQEWIAAGQVSLNGGGAIAKQKVWGGETVVVLPQTHPAEQPYQAEDIAFEIVYEDDALLVINKHVGLVMHPGSGNWEGTLLNALLHHAPQLEKVPRAGIVHRLDKDTSGLLVVAKTLIAQTALVRQLQARSVKREYLALAWGEVRHGGMVDAPIGRHPTQRVKMAVLESGKPAVTHYQIEEKFPTTSTLPSVLSKVEGSWQAASPPSTLFRTGSATSGGSGQGCTLLRCRLETGRTHQIRVHLAHIGHPLVGDGVYLKGAQKCMPQLRNLLHSFPRQALHATRLALEHPDSGIMMEWQALLPQDMQLLLQQIREAINPDGHGRNVTPDHNTSSARSPHPNPGGTTSHSTKLANNASQVAGYPPEVEGTNESLREFYVK